MTHVLTKLWNRSRTRPSTPSPRRDFVASHSKWLQDFKNHRVLDVGCDADGELVRILSEDFRPREVIGINPHCADQIINAKSRLIRGDIRNTDFENDSFDSIISVSAFEHIHDLEVALFEMRRILKPGGMLYSKFGPIWSTSYGHHLWLRLDGAEYTYWNTPLSPFCHLLKSRDEIAAEVASLGHGEPVCQAIAEFVLHSPDQNQLMFDGYRDVVDQSGLEVCFFKGYDHPALAKKYTSRCTPEIISAMQAKYGELTSFWYDGIEMLLRKSSAERLAGRANDHAAA